jgi:Cof subfamily protein (haloacid dehalogenase superfamily)
MKSLYISDLDGTLLNDKVKLSDYTIDTLNALIQQGIHFTIATARTAASVTKILAPLTLNIPVILMNGVLLYDIPSGQYLDIQRLSKEGITAILEVLKNNNLTGFMYEVKDNILTTYYERLESKALREFYEERVREYQKSFLQVSDFSIVDPEHIIYFALLDSKERLEPAYQILKTNPNIALAFYKDIYSDEDLWYLELFSVKATKYNAAQILRNRYEFNYMVGFGDNLNDLPLFQACDETCAVSNAKPEVKIAATHIIESNLEDGVAHWLEGKL